MSSEQLYLIVILFIIVSGIVLLNDKLKSQKQKQAKSSKLHKRPHGWKFLFATFALIVSIFVVSIVWKDRSQDILKWSFYIFAGIVLLIINFVIGKSLWLLIRSIYSGNRLLVTQKKSNGTTTIKCPNCSGIMRLNKEENLFECSNCDETLSFVSNPK